MERIEVDLPDEFAFSTTLSVRVGDVNYGGHLGNDDVLSLVHEARIRYLNDLGYREVDVGGPGLIMKNAEINYESEADIGDQLSIDVSSDQITDLGFNQYYRLRNKSSGERIASVRAAMLGYDYDEERVVRLPEPFINRLKSKENSDA